MYTKNEKIVPVYIEDEMKESYISYAMSVIVGRALPDVRDGLKPVHRRILYAMKELNLEHNKPYKKSARITGEVLGKFHPHGDMAVYDALVRMVQDFSLRYPLVDGQGNFGSVDGDAPAAMRYCVTGDSLIVTDGGLQRIEKIPHQSEVSFYTLSMNNKINHVSKWFDSGECSTRMIETHRGFNLCGSLNHPILTWQNGQERPQFKWKLLKDVKKGDYTVISRCDSLFPKKEPDLRQFYPKLKNRWGVHKLPHVMSKDLALILGALVSEGNIGRKQVGFCNNDKEFITQFKSSFKKVFPDCRLHEFVRKPAGFTKKCYTSLEIHSLQVIEFLKNLGLIPSRARGKIVPEVIFKSSKKSIATFIRAFAEGDGSVYISSSLNNLEVTFISASKKLMQELQILLLRFGIESSYRFQKPRNVFKLFIRNHENLNLFKREIDFVTERKRKKLEEISKRNSSGWVMPKTDFIPYLAAYIRKQYKNRRIKYGGHKELLLRRNIDRYTKIAKYWPEIEGVLDKKDAILYKHLMENRYIFDKIISAKNNGVKRVYSIKVDSPCHSFVSNGIISHNTEARLAHITDWILADIEKETVKFVPNFDDTLKEPAVLPAALPNLLVNGSSGIAVGMATNIPPHNLKEVTDAVAAVIDDPGIDIKDMMKYIKGPDFPTGGIICGKDGIISAYKTGRGRITLHAKANTEDLKSGKRQIVITEIPYQVNKTNLIESIAGLVQSKRLEGISDIRDESDKDGMRIVVELKRDQNAEVILNQLYKHTQMQTTFGVIMLALVDNRPEVLNLKEMISHYIKFRKEIITNRTKFDLAKAEERAHILEGLKIALKNLDKIISLIRRSKDPKEAKDALMKEFELSERQAQAILEMQLQRLTNLEREKIDNEYMELLKKIEYFKSILDSEKKVLEIIKNEALDLKSKFGDERKTAILGKVEELAMEDLIAEEDVVITISHSGYIKRLPVSSYRKQKRGGKGVTGAEMKEEDFAEDIFIASTHENMLFFTDKGKAHLLKVYDIPQASRQSKGKAIVNLLCLAQGEKTASSMPVKEFKEGKYLFMVTKNGTVKKTELSEFENIRRGGMNAINIEKDDALINTQLTEEGDEIFIATKEGKAIRFPEKLVRNMGRNATGVRGIRLAKKDEVVGMAVVKDKKAALLSVTKNGFGKRTLVSEYRLTSRGGAGVINMKVTSKNGPVVGLKMASDRDDIVLITHAGMIVRCAVKDIRTTGRAAQGVRIIRLGSKDGVVSMASVVKEDDAADSEIEPEKQ